MKTDYFQLWLLDKSNKNIGIVRSNTHLHLENDNIFSIDQIMVTRAGMLVVRRASCHLCMEGHLKLHKKHYKSVSLKNNIVSNS